MSHRKTLSRLTVASLAAAALAAPAATAMPVDPTAGTVKDHWQAHMPVNPKSAHQDLRSEAASGASGSPLRHPSLAGPPTWPEHPQVIHRAPAPPAGGGGGGGEDDAPVLLLAIGGALVLGGGMAVTAVRLRARTAH